MNRCLADFIFNHHKEVIPQLGLGLFKQNKRMSDLLVASCDSQETIRN